MDNNDMLRQAEEFQRRMAEAEKALEKKEVAAQSGGGLVTVEGTANGKVSGVFLDPALYGVESRHMAEDLIKAAFNAFQENVVEAARTVSTEILKHS